MYRGWNSLGSALAALGLAACAPLADAPDGQLHVTLDADVAPARPLAEPFEGCAHARECSPEASVCLTAADGFVGGLCTRPCRVDAGCPEGGVCVEGHCRRGCRTTCPRRGYVCVADAHAPLHCQSHCGGDGDCEGARCEIASGRCVSTNVAPPRGHDLGQHCDHPSECAGGMCLWSFVDPRLDGYCSRPCELRDGDARSNCPADARCVAVTSVEGPGGLGGCVTECRGHDDCALGYACQRIVDLQLCVPSCGDAHPCPRGFFCDRRSEARPICRPARH